VRLAVKYSSKTQLKRHPDKNKQVLEIKTACNFMIAYYILWGAGHLSITTVQTKKKLEQNVHCTLAKIDFSFLKQNQWIFKEA
jgi:hypothetical protein